MATNSEEDSSSDESEDEVVPRIDIGEDDLIMHAFLAHGILQAADPFDVIRRVLSEFEVNNIPWNRPHQ